MTLMSSRNAGTFGASARQVLAWLVILAPFLLYAAFIPRFGELQRNDYWSNFKQVVNGDELRREPLAWLDARSNEHRITLPLLLWTANARVSHGDNRVLSTLSLALLVGTFVCLYRLLPEPLRAPAGTRVAFGLPLAALLATPVAAHCWVMGFSGNQWFLANFSSVLALALFARLPPESGPRELLPVVAAGLLGVFAHSTHLALWPTLWLGAALLPLRRGARALLALASAGVGALFVAGYTVPGGHPTPSLESAPLFDFFRTYLGMLGSSAIAGARAYGTVALLLFGAALVLTLRSDRDRRRLLAPWLLLAVYAGLNGIGTSVARLGFGEGMALSSRYASLPALFWLGILMALGLAASTAALPRRRALGLGLVAAVTVALLAPMWVLGATQLRRQLQTVERQPLGALAMRWGVVDPWALESIGFGAGQLQQSREFFVRWRHIPYDRLAEWPLRAPWPREMRPAPPTAVGRWQSTAPLSPRFLRVAGRLAAPPPAGSRILLLDGQSRVWGGGVFIPRRRAPPPELLSRPRLPPAWTGYLLSECAGPITAYVEFPGSPGLTPLAADAGAEFSCREIAGS